MGRRIEDHPDGTRTCTSCGGRFPLETSFDIDKNATLGHRSHCKPCRSERMKAWYAANRERQATRAQARRDADPERHRKHDLERYYRSKPKRIALVEAHGHKRRALKAQTHSVDGITQAAHDWDNVSLCCRRCNQRKGARTVEQYRMVLAHEAGQLFAHG